MRKQKRKVNVYDRLNTLKFMGIMAACAFTLVAFEWKFYDREVVACNWDDGEILDAEPDIMPVPKKQPNVKEVVTIRVKKKKADPNNFILVDNIDVIQKTGPIVLEVDSMPEVPNIEPEFYEKEIVKPERYPDVKASFPGGDPALMKFLSGEISYPDDAFNVGITGKVYLQFVVRKDGNIDQITVMKGIGGGCEEESVRALSNSPKWKPGSVEGEAVDTYFNLPVNFTLK